MSTWHSPGYFNLHCYICNSLKQIHICKNSLSVSAKSNKPKLLAEIECLGEATNNNDSRHFQTLFEIPKIRTALDCLYYIPVVVELQINRSSVKSLVFI